MKTLICSSRPLISRCKCSSPSHTPFHHSIVLLFHGFSSSFSSSSSSSSSSWSSWRLHHDEESRNVKVSVWWDFENCSVPVGVNVVRVGQRITCALRANGIKGPVSITAFGDVSQLSRSNQEALTSTGINLAHVPRCGKNSADRSLLLDLVLWVSQNPPPAHLFLISGDKDFSNILHRLRMNNYNILLASTDCTSGVLCSAASIMWQWNSLVRGDSLTGKHFNHPPDGMYGSWYGHYKGPLDNPFSDAEQSSFLQAEESAEPTADVKPQPVPKELLNRIREILHTFPDGVSLSELRSEIGKSNINLDKDLFGYKKFSRLLLSMPDVLRLQRHPSGEGQPLVYGIQRKTAEPIISKPKPSTGLDLNDRRSNHGPSNEGLPTSGNISHPYLRSDELVDNGSKSAADGMKVQFPSVESGKKSLPSMRAAVDACVPSDEKIPVNTVCDSTSLEQHDSLHDKGFLRGVWKTWFGHKTGNPCEERNNSPDKSSTRDSSPDPKLDCRGCVGLDKRENNKHKTNQTISVGPAQLGSKSKSCDESKSNLQDGTVVSSGNSDGKSSKSSGFFEQFIRWLKFWEAKETLAEQGSVLADQSVKSSVPAKSREGADQIKCELVHHHLFSKPYFWDDLKSFFQTSKGSAIISQSMTRKHLARELQNNGPLILKALNASYFPKLVDLLISEKRWVEESSSQTFPFKLTLTAEVSSSSTSHARGSNDLSSIFTNTTHQLNLQRLPEEQEKKEKRSQTLNGNAVPANVNEQPQTLEDLKAWLKRVRNWVEITDAETFNRYFEKEFWRKLKYSSYGFSDLDSLFLECSSDNCDPEKANKNKSRVMADCKSLLTDLLLKNPEGIYIRSFKALFYKQYGYFLDQNALGYQSLKVLLQKIMPGVHVGTTLIRPSKKAHWNICEEMNKEKSSRLSDNDVKVESSAEAALAGRGISNVLALTDQNSLWEELGPVTETGRGRSGNEPGLAEHLMDSHAPAVKSVVESKSNQEMLEELESLLSSEEDTDSEDETVIEGSKGPEEYGSVEKSSLLQVLDSWHSSNDGDQKDRLQNIDECVDCSIRMETSSPLDSSAIRADGIHQAASCRAKLRHQKSFSFVSDAVSDDKERQLDSILSTLKKSMDSGMHG